MSNLTRYNCEIKLEGGWAKALMIPSASGEWVKFDDTKELLRTVRAKLPVQHLKAEISGVLDSMQYRVTDGIDPKTLQFYINEIRQKLSAVE